VNKKKEVGIHLLPNLHLPDGWVLGEVQDLVKIRNGYAFKSKDFNVEKGVPVIRQTNLSTDPINFDKPKFLPEDFLENYSGYKIEKGDVLIGLSGSIGSLSTYREDFPALQNQRTGVLIENVEGSKKYVEYFLLFIKRQLNEVAKGVAVQNISSKQIEGWPIPIAPLEQQKRIVAEVEKQFSRLDEAVANLKRVKANLKRYKAAVLKAAVEGKLTEEWRKQHPDVEPASKLLERILAERRQKWEEAELTKMKTKGKAPEDDNWKKKYKEPEKPIDGQNRPSTWTVIKTDQLFCFVTSGSRGWAKYYSDKGATFLRMGNLDHDSVELDLTNLQFVRPPEGVEGTRTQVQSNDILISITADVGMIAVVPSGFGEAYINQHISLARPVGVINSQYLAWFLASRPGQRQFQDLQRGATKVGLGLDDIRSVNVPMPPLTEQDQIVSEIERKFSVVDVIEKEMLRKLMRAERLRQSILSEAFSGKLVGDDSAGLKKWVIHAQL